MVGKGFEVGIIAELLDWYFLQSRLKQARKHPQTCTSLSTAKSTLFLRPGELHGKVTFMMWFTAMF
jgi:hypothetical protein